MNSHTPDSWIERDIDDPDDPHYEPKPWMKDEEDEDDERTI